MRTEKDTQTCGKSLARKWNRTQSVVWFSLVLSDDWPSKRGSIGEIFNEMLVFAAARDINFGRFWMRRRRNRRGLPSVEGSMSLSLKSKMSLNGFFSMYGLPFAKNVWRAFTLTRLCMLHLWQKLVTMWSYNGSGVFPGEYSINVA